MDNDIYKKLGIKIKAERLLLNLTLDAASQKIDISENFLSCLERNIEAPSIETLVKIANTYKVSIDYLLSDSIISKPKEPEFMETIYKIFGNLSDKEFKIAIKLLKLLVENIDTLNKNQEK